jgi:hypothetical protein
VYFDSIHHLNCVVQHYLGRNSIRYEGKYAKITCVVGSQSNWELSSQKTDASPCKTLQVKFDDLMVKFSLPVHVSSSIDLQTELHRGFAFVFRSEMILISHMSGIAEFSIEFFRFV